ncbi:metallophosphoesterase [Marinibactrum halimedae]|uniref:Calcineurin-like phosphoesterase domain-containing protein n=1 Tax=Marinibactrum halimedae TaxID=1444977 RepID=A0AA37TF33_9GAMM|nr:metallophosphoesterase [Marinibactrum halimedae]MCD9460534.1 metallophosphoesterase [Marinibactrum halimedae]GLS27897.1 hypothetical protein GCM10007877_36160 [Marinibactrum halimedae]
MILSGCNIDVIVEGKGTVISDPDYIQCRSDSGVCRVEDYQDLDLDIEDSIVTFRAIADEGYVLDRWSGDCDQTIANKCRVVLGDDVEVNAYFRPIPFAEGDGNTNKSVRFIALGDTGEGNRKQYQVGTAIKAWCDANGCDFALGLGDNFYDGTPTHIYDEQFDTKFELPYQALNFPFYVVLGNHDTGRFDDGDGGNQALGNVQVQYHYRSDRLTEKWQMPSRYYTVLPQGDSESPLVQLFALDSAPFVGIIDPNNEYNPERYASGQGAWFRSVVDNSQADWKIAFTHHPYVSNGRHGNARNYDRTIPGGALLDKVSGKIFKDFMDDYVCNRVDILFSGHDHNLQALKPVAECGLTEFVVSGAGAKANGLERPNDNAVYFQHERIEGFMYVIIRGNTLTLQSIGVDIDTALPRVLATTTIKRKILPN